jgi:hypothetical protein
MDEQRRGSRSQAGPRRAPASPFDVPAPLDSDSEMRAALDVWAGACFELSLPDLAVDLLDSATAGSGSNTSTDRALRRAMYLLEADRFIEALSALPLQYRELPGDPSDVHVGHLVQATADGALGDQEALRWLTSLAAPLLHSDAVVFHALCLARAGDALDDRELADAAYRQLGHLGFVDRRTTPRSAALLMGERDQSDLDVAQQTLNETLQMIQDCSQSVATDPQPLLQTAAELIHRGDRGGATLLLKWASRMDPRGERVREAFAPLSPARVGARRGSVLTLLWLCAAVISGYGIWHATPAALLPIAAVILLWHRYVPMPGMSLVDSRLYRRIRPLRANPVTPGETLRYSVIGIVTVAFCAIWAVVSLAAIGSRMGIPWGALPAWIEVVVWTIAMGVVPGLVTVGLWYARRRRRDKEADLESLATQQDLIASSQRCRCWTTPVLSGDQARVYLEHHLRPVELPAKIADLTEAHSDRRLRTAYCSRTGAAWLRITIGAEGAGYLLRGPLGSSSAAPTEDANTPTATGFYL